MGSNVLWNQNTSAEFFDRAAVAAKLPNMIPNNIFYVDSSNSAASSSNDGLTRAKPFSTLAQALAKCTDSRGDVVVLLPGHSETLASSTAGVAFSQAGVSVLGIGNGRNRPVLTCAGADIVGVLLSGSNNLLQNIRIVGSTSQTTATSFALAITGDDNRVVDCVFEHGGAGPLVAVGLSGADRTIIEGCTWIGTAAGPDMGMKIYGSSTHLQVRRCLFNYGTVNVDSAAIGVLASSNCANSVFEDIVILGANSTGIRILGSGAATVPDSLIARVYGTSNTGITFGTAMPFDPGGAAVANCFWTDATAAEPGWIGAALRVGTAVVTATTTGRGFISAGPS